MARILIVDDEEKLRNLLSMMLESQGHMVDKAGDGKEGFLKQVDETYDLVISDIKMPEMDGKDLIAQMRSNKIHTPVIFITAFATIDSAVEMMRAGAIDYITKPFDEEKIYIAVERGLRISGIYAENMKMKEALKEKQTQYQIIFGSQIMKNVVKQSESVAKTDTAVLITGESGTGKELFARYIHNSSSRKGNPFVPVNCAAISPNLVESELFGYEKGAFTGANSKKMGKFEYAASGTIFLDEIGDMPLEAQTKLLRALQEKRFQRVGGNQEIPADVRVVCATNRNLEEMVEKNQFRQDLFYRINVFPIQIPPLRMRKEDILPLAAYMLKRFDFGHNHSITEDACRILQAYNWPGNVRELANVIERSIILTMDTKAITSETLSFLNGNVKETSSFQIEIPPGGLSLDQVQQAFVKQALTEAGNNQTKAAELLGISRARFRVLLKNSEEGK